MSSACRGWSSSILTKCDVLQGEITLGACTILQIWLIFSINQATSYCLTICQLLCHHPIFLDTQIWLIPINAGPSSWKCKISGDIRCNFVPLQILKTQRESNRSGNEKSFSEWKLLVLRFNDGCWTAGAIEVERKVPILWLCCLGRNWDALPHCQLANWSFCICKAM